MRAATTIHRPMGPAKNAASFARMMVTRRPPNRPEDRQRDRWRPRPQAPQEPPWQSIRAKSCVVYLDFDGLPSDGRDFQHVHQGLQGNARVVDDLSPGPAPSQHTAPRISRIVARV